MTVLLDAGALTSRLANRNPQHKPQRTRDPRTCPQAPPATPAPDPFELQPLRSVPPRCELYQQGTDSTTLFYIREGLIKVSTQHPQRAECLHLLGPGDLLGEEVLDGRERRGTAVTVVPTTYHELSAWLLDDLIAQNPLFIRALLAKLGSHVSSTRQLLDQLAGAPPMVRVAHCVESLTRQLGIVTSGGVLVEHGLTQRELSLVVGSSRETVNRTLHAFVDKGWLTIQQRSFLVMDLEGLLDFGRRRFM